MKKWTAKKYSKEEFVEAWYASDSISEVVKKLIGTMSTGRISGGNWNTINKFGKELGLSRDHFKPNKGNPNFGKITKISMDEILVKDSTYNSTFNLKQRLYSEGLKEERCELCDITEWMGSKAPLCLDHINGDRMDNRIENLRILCHNCHAQTETFAGKNRGSKATVG